jgi:hypothetical protein
MNTLTGKISATLITQQTSIFIALSVVHLGVLAALRFIGTMIVLCFHIFNHTDDVSPGCGSYIGAHATLAAQA